MHLIRPKLVSDRGWTFIEVALSVVLISIVVLGLTIVMLAFKEHLDRSWMVRTMDQYGNDVVEWVTHDMRNAQDVIVRPSQANVHRVFVYRTNLRTGIEQEILYSADLRNGRVLINNRNTINPSFPPAKLKRGESIQITRFTVTQYGVDTPNNRERVDRFGRDAKFLNATYDIRFALRYTKLALKPGQKTWTYEKEYFNRVYMRNKNLVVKKGIVG